MKIFQIIDQPSGGGAERICKNLSNSLIKKNFDTTVFYLKNNQGVKLKKHENCYTGFFGYIGIVFYIRKRIKSFIKTTDNIVVVHGHLSRPLYLIPLITLGLDCKRVFTEHNTHYKRRNISILSYVELFIYKNYDLITCVSEACKKNLKEWIDTVQLKAKIVVVYNGIKIKPFNCKRENKFSGVYKFISIGSLTQQKGFDVSIAALSKIKSLNWEYDILGEGPELSSLKKLSKDLGILDKVKFIGYQDNTSKYLREANIMIIPSRWEGFGLVAVESLSHGLPIVASDVPGMREVLIGCNSCFLTKKEDEAKLALSIEKVMFLVSKNSDFCKGARLHAYKFSEDIMVNNYIEKYNQIIS